MVELVGDICMPSDLIVPEDAGGVYNNSTISGAQLFLSGSILYYYMGATLCSLSGTNCL